MPQFPKKPELRQRRNQSASRAVLVAEEEPRTRAPSLPSRGVDGDGNELAWHEMTKRWWKEVWASPMAGEYLRADEQALFRLAVLVDAFWATPTIALSREIREVQKTFGLTPLDRRRLEWQVQQVEDASLRLQEKRVGRARERAREAGDPRRVLQEADKKQPQERRAN
ncbi:MAG: hypothetical protein HUU38_14965 [Anaerolineales bacterium]|nr:hypothetical protein [Anaerolineales bacterium]